MSGSDPSQSSAASSAPAHLPLDIHDPSASLMSSHRCHPHLYFPSHWLHLPNLTAGAGPFVTKLVHSLPSGSTVFWESRKHRKRLQQSVRSPAEESVRERVQKGELSAKDGQQVLERGRRRERLRRPWYRRLFPFKPGRIPWWTAVLFDVGSLCFVFSSICSFIPHIYSSASLNTGYVGWTAFAGSLFFTVGSLFGVAEVLKAPIIGHWFALSKEEEQRLGLLAKEQKSKSGVTFLSLLSRLDFYITMIQAIGATAFSVNTLAFTGEWMLSTHETTWLVDFCDVFASCCFTLTGYLSVAEVTHSISPISSLDNLRSLDWYISLQSLFGGIGFLINGVLIIYYPNAGQLQPAYALLIGSVFFQISSHLQYMEQSDRFDTEDSSLDTSAPSEANGFQPQQQQQQSSAAAARNEQPLANGDGRWQQDGDGANGVNGHRQSQ